MTTTGSELAIPVQGVVVTPLERVQAAEAVAGSLDSWLIVMKDVVYLAEKICDTSFVPKAYRGDAPAVAAAILAGRELGLPPMTSLRHVQVVEGSPGLSAEYKRARVLSAGHKLDITEHTTEACTVTGHRKGHESVTVRFTIQDARRARLVKDRGAWETRPRRMLFARAATEVCDALFSDLTNGLPTAELLEEEADWEQARSVENIREGVADEASWRRQRATAADARARTPQTVTATVVTPDASPAGTDAPQSEPPAAPAAETAPAGEAPATRRPNQATTGQVGMIKKRYADLYGYAIKDETAEQKGDRLVRLTRLAGVEYPGISSTKDLTPDEAGRVLIALQQAADTRALEAAVAAMGANHGE